MSDEEKREAPTKEKPGVMVDQCYVKTIEAEIHCSCGQQSCTETRERFLVAVVLEGESHAYAVALDEDECGRMIKDLTEARSFILAANMGRAANPKASA